MNRNIRGGWPAEHYEKLLEIQTTMLSDLIQVGAFDVLVGLLLKRLVHVLVACWFALDSFAQVEESVVAQNCLFESQPSESITCMCNAVSNPI